MGYGAHRQILKLWGRNTKHRHFVQTMAQQILLLQKELYLVFMGLSLSSTWNIFLHKPMNAARGKKN